MDVKHVIITKTIPKLFTNVTTFPVNSTEQDFERHLPTKNGSKHTTTFNPAGIRRSNAEKPNFPV
jgi:hypothetical protein